jgi:hypothetical protein
MLVCRQCARQRTFAAQDFLAVLSGSLFQEVSVSRELRKIDERCRNGFKLSSCAWRNRA